MAFYKQDIVDINLNTGNIHRSFLNHAIGYKNDDADRFGIRTFRDGVPQDLTGASCQAVFMAPNGSKIALTSYGTVSGNVAYVTLPPACYDYEGQFCLAIQLVGGGVTGTMRIVDGMVVNTGASGTVAPTSSVPTYQEIIAQYDAMVAATAAANGAIAATYSGSATYKVGDYCIHDGGLYRCTTAITTAEAWNAAHWTATKIGPDVSDLKSALGKYVPVTLSYIGGRGINASGVITSSASYTIWYFPVVKGRTYEFTTEDSSYYYGWFTDIPVASATAYDNTRHIGTGARNVATAPINGYLAFRSAASAQTQNITAYTVSANDTEAIDKLKDIETIFSEIDIPVTVTGGRGINASGEITTSASYNIWYCKVLKDCKYTFTTQDSAYYYGWFENVPIAGETAYDGTRYTSQSATTEVTSPIDGYLAFRSSSSFADASAKCYSSIDVIAREKINQLVGAKETAYVSTTGNDDNDGTLSNPYRTINKAITSGASKIIVAQGTYTEAFNSYFVRSYLELSGDNATVYLNELQIRNAVVNVEGFTFICNTEADASGLFLRQCEGTVSRCTAKDFTYMGFRLDGSKITLVDCIADGAGVDGFNAHDTSYISDCTFINCKAVNCGDDGLSFHENGIIHVLGGEYANNASTGIAPHNNCNCDIKDAYIHHNGRAGIEALVGNVQTLPDPLPTMVLTGCIFESNVGNAVTAEHYIVKACGNGASENGTNAIVNDGGSTITTFTIMQ